MSGSLKLRTGAVIPKLGLGTWEVRGEAIDAVLREAIKTGYRHIDCAAIYENEKEVGQCLSKLQVEGLVSRSDLFITSKLWCTMMDPVKVEAALDQTLQDLQLNCLDLYLIHWPMSFEPSAAGRSQRDASGKIKLSSHSISSVWKAMNSTVEKGMTKAIGVSNFTIERLQQLIDETGIVPAVNQVELHPYLQQDELVAYCKAKGIVVEAYSPLGAGRDPRLLDDHTIGDLAKAEGLTPAQLLISWGVTRDTVVLTRTSNSGRVAENFKVKPLSASTMEAIAGIKTHHRYVDAADWAGHQVF